MKSGQLIKYNMRNSFFGKSCTKCDGETILRSFLKKSKFGVDVGNLHVVHPASTGKIHYRETNANIRTTETT